MSAAGCGPTAAAIIASGYNGEITPEDFRAYIINKMFGGRVANYSNASNMATAFSGINVGAKIEVAAFDVNKIKNTLKSGGQVWIVVQNCKYTSGAHCMALIDYKDNNQVYVAHGTAKSRPFGWDSLDYIKTYNKHATVLYVGGM